MKKLVLFLLLASPLLALAQVNDMYFVPKKEKKVLVVKSAEEIYLVDDVENVDNGGEYTDEYVDEAETAYFTNDLYDVMDDYTYSTRIVRFQSPSRLLSTNLYWDLKYSCGINDWLVYDNGYTVYIYPTANNIFYNDPYYYNRVNLWNWNTYHTWYYPYYRHNYWWDCYDYHWNHHNHHYWAHHNHYWHKPYYGYHGSHNLSWKPTDRKSNIPINGSIAGKPHRDQPVRTATNGNNPRREQPRTTANGNNPRREQQARTTANGNNPRREQQVRTTANGNNPRREQQVRSGNGKNGSSATANRQPQSRTSVNNSNVKRSSSSSSSSGSRVERGGSRSSGNSSGGYSRPSSTGVSRSSGSSSSGGSRGGGSSYSSGGGGSRGGSNHSSGGHSGGGGRSSGTRR